MAEEINQDWIATVVQQQRSPSQSPKSKYGLSATLQVYTNYNQSIRIDDDGEAGIKARTFNLHQEDPLIQTFPTNMSKISNKSTQNKQIKAYQNVVPKTLEGRTSVDSEPEPSQEEIKRFNLSIMTDRVKQPTVKINKNNENEFQNKKFQESFYMKPDKVAQEQPPKTQLPKRLEQKSKSKVPLQPMKVGSQHLITVIFRSTNYFLECPKCSIQVDSTSLHDMCDEFFRLEAYIPLFNYELFDTWMLSPNKYQLKQQSHTLFRIYLERYTAYLNQHYPKQFEQVLDSLLQIQQGKNTKKLQSSTFSSLLSFDFSSIIDRIMKIVKSSKTQFLRDCLMAKARSLRQAAKYCEQGGQKMKHHLASLQATEESTWADLGEIQLLLSLQRTEEYCCKKIEDSIEPKFKDIYSKYRECMRAQKKKHLSSLDSLLL